VAPFDLDTKQLIGDVQSEIDPAVLTDRPPDPYAEPHRGQHDRLLGDGSLVVRIQHERMFA